MTMPSYSIAEVGPRGGIKRRRTVFAPSAMEAVNGSTAPDGRFLNVSRLDELADELRRSDRRRAGYPVEEVDLDPTWLQETINDLREQGCDDEFIQCCIEDLQDGNQVTVHFGEHV